MFEKGLKLIVVLGLGIIIPSLLVLVLQDRFPKESLINTRPTTSVSASLAGREITVELADGEVVEMLVDEYVLGVVLSEMPANFELEALKAQAVVARTYALRRCIKKGNHEVAAVCTKTSCCQGFCDTTEYVAGGGKTEDVAKIQSAVEMTSNLVVVYEGALIDATYFSCSGGRTEDASAVWGTEIPYLQSVKSPGEDRATHFVDTVQYSCAEFLQKLGLPVTGKNKIEVGAVTFTKGGGVAQIEICGQSFSGTSLRKMLELRSTALLITVVGNTVTVTTKGNGHRVGMSQYGADAMALEGATFDEILAHYYRGTQLIPFDFD